MKKLCNKCGNKKDLKEFSPDKKGTLGVRYFCKECQSEYQRKYYRSWRKRKRMEWVDIIKSIGREVRCEKCGYDKCLYALEFHHKNGSEKEHSMSNLMVRIPTEQRVAELSKVQILCANCHREVHAEEWEMMDER